MFDTDYNFYSGRVEMELVTTIVDALKQILEEDKKQEQPLFLKVEDDFIMNVARKVVHEKKNTFLIGITGESASGKTVFVDNTIEAVVREKKEGIYTVVRCDDYYKDTSKQLIAAGSYDALFKTGFSFDTPDAIDLKLMKEHLLALKNGQTVTSPRYDFITCESKPDGDVKKPAKVILTEGLYVLDESLRDIMDIKVFVDTDADIRFIRRLERDTYERGRDIDSVISQYLNTVKPMHDEFVEPTKKYADIIVPRGGHNKVALHMIIERIKSILNER